jgi:hypothetical protein
VWTCYVAVVVDSPDELVVAEIAAVVRELH